MEKKDHCASPLCSKQELTDLIWNIKGKKVTVVGLGLFGGGEGAVRFFAGSGAKVTVTDLKTKKQLAPVVSKLAGLPVKFRLGSHKESDILSSDLLVLNPALRRDGEIVKLAEKNNIRMTSPMNVFLALCKAPIAAVTGTVGKSTTTAMLAAMMSETSENVYMGGNIGISMLDSLGNITASDLVILELSSVQLEDAAALKFSPALAVVTNIMPNHLERYGTFQAYAAAKENIMKHQGPEDFLLLNRADSLLRDRWAPAARGQVVFFDSTAENSLRISCPGYGYAEISQKRAVFKVKNRKEVLFTGPDLPLIGQHNTSNAIAAAAAAKLLGAGTENIRLGLKRFKTLEHRLEPCRTLCGISFYNDSDSTTPESTIAAIQSFPPPISLICGGKDKGLRYNKLAEAIADKVSVLVTLGCCGPHIAQLTREAGAGSGTSPIIVESSSLSDAIRQAYKLSMPGSTVLFSPSCASFDMFQNFAERGREFKKIVRNLERNSASFRASA